jgi:hypothetical protein
MTRRGTEPGLARKLESGEYAIDEHAVAEAMIGRLVRGELPRSAMLVSGKRADRRAVRAGEDGAGAGASLA